MQPLSDYGKLHVTSATHIVRRPRTVVEVQETIADARVRACRVRVRGSGHSMSGATLPRDGEVLLRTERLDHYRFESPGSITVGAGALAWDVRDLAARHGWRMPVYNGGWAGPTVGGFVCAGGMGVRSADLSETPGGFWEFVDAVTLVDGRGSVHEFTPANDVFPWLFGSFGQLGVIVEVRLRLIAAAAESSAYPLGESGIVPRLQRDDPVVNDRPAGAGGDAILYWFSNLIAPEQEDIAWRELGGWVTRHAPFLDPVGGWAGPLRGGVPVGYRYRVPFHRFHPPLIYPHSRDFLLIGVMSLFRGVGTSVVDERILDVERDFQDVAARNGFRLYPQAENFGRRVDFAAYYGAVRWSQFIRLKDRFDPDRLLNADVVFPSRQ